jgi:hypothetical protein
MNKKIKKQISFALLVAVFATSIIVSTLALAENNMVFANTISSNSTTAQASECSTRGDNMPISPGSCNNINIDREIDTGINSEQ